MPHNDMTSIVKTRKVSGRSVFIAVPDRVGRNGNFDELRQDLRPTEQEYALPCQYPQPDALPQVSGAGIAGREIDIATDIRRLLWLNTHCLTLVHRGGRGTA